MAHDRRRGHRLLRRPVWLGTIRRTRPLSDHWGADRGTPVDRYYVERFLAAHGSDIRGRLQFVYDVRAAVGEAHRLLRPDGVLLATVPAVSRIDATTVSRARQVTGAAGDFWRFTVDSCTALFGDAFGSPRVSVRSYGNVLTCVAFLMGLACEELSARELEEHDELFPLVVAVRAVKA